MRSQMELTLAVMVPLRKSCLLSAMAEHQSTVALIVEWQCKLGPLLLSE